MKEIKKNLKDPSYCCKFYWLEAIVHLISENVTETTFDAIIDEMIANAWYSVREFRIHLSGLLCNSNSCNLLPESCPEARRHIKRCTRRIFKEHKVDVKALYPLKEIYLVIMGKERVISKIGPGQQILIDSLGLELEV